MLRGNDFEIGPAESFDVRCQGIPYPMFTSLVTEGHKVTVKAENAAELQWIADGQVIMKRAIGSEAITLDLDAVEGAEDFAILLKAGLYNKETVLLILLLKLSFFML